MVQQSGDSSFQLVDMMQNNSSPLIGFWRRKSLARQVEGIRIVHNEDNEGKGLLMEVLE